MTLPRRTDKEIEASKREIRELRNSKPDPEKLKLAHTRFLRWLEDKKAGRLPMYEKA